MVSLKPGALIFVLRIAMGTAFLFGLFSNNEVKYQVYTRNNMYQFSDKNLWTFDTSKLCHFIILDYSEKEDQEHYTQLKKNYLEKEDCNVVYVIWKAGILGTFSRGARRAMDAGENLGTLIYHLHRKYYLSLDQVHLIGLGVGAHAAGAAGRMVKRLTHGEYIRRITGLDPSRYLFKGLLRVFKPLTPRDAQIVDVIHTDGGVLGIEEPLGTVDFYPNGGIALQPYCKKSLLPPLYDVLGLMKRGGCSHRKSMQYFVASVMGMEFSGRVCESWDDYQHNLCKTHEVVMGDSYYPYEGAVGNVYLRTSLEGDV